MSSFKYFFFFLIITLFISCSSNQDKQIEKNYECSDGTTLKVTYINEKQSNKALVHFMQQDLLLNLTVSASGARYSNKINNFTYTWHTKADFGTLFVEKDKDSEIPALSLECTDQSVSND